MPRSDISTQMYAYIWIANQKLKKNRANLFIPENIFVRKKKKKKSYIHTIYNKKLRKILYCKEKNYIIIIIIEVKEGVEFEWGLLDLS